MNFGDYFGSLLGADPSVLTGIGNIPIVFKGLGGVVIPITFKQ